MSGCRVGWAAAEDTLLLDHASFSWVARHMHGSLRLAFDSADMVGWGTPLSMRHTASRQSLGNSLLSASPDASPFTGRETRGFSNQILCRLSAPGCSICSSSSNALEYGPLLEIRCWCLHSGCQSGNRRYVKGVDRFAAITSIGLSRLTTVCSPSLMK